MAGKEHMRSLINQLFDYNRLLCLTSKISYCNGKIKSFTAVVLVEAPSKEAEAESV